MSKEAHSYAMTLANSMTKITMESFFEEIHDQFYPDTDVSFMEYFLELTKQEYEFVVPHAKLIEYGAITSTRSANILDRLTALGLENDKDYLLLDVQQQVVSGVKHCKHYNLTPEAFKKCLMRAQRRVNQPVDPTIYCDYYLLLEKVFKLFTDYERQYSVRLLQCKDDKIDQQSRQLQLLLNKSDQIIGLNGDLSNQVTALSGQNNELTNQVSTLSTSVDSLTTEVDSLTTEVGSLTTEVSLLIEEVARLNLKIDALFDTVLSFAQMIIPTWIGASIIKQQYEKLLEHKTSHFATTHLKVMFMVGFWRRVADPETLTSTSGVKFTNYGNLRIYACCTNFADVGARIKLLYNRHTDSKTHPVMFMLKPMAVTLISCEINSERIILENADHIFPESSIVRWDSRYKSFELDIDTDDRDEVALMFQNICTNATTLRFQDYQQRVEMFNRTSDVTLSPSIINYLSDQDDKFFDATRQHCQAFVSSYTRRQLDQNTKELVEYYYSPLSRSTEKRSDFGDVRMTKSTYALNRIKVILDEHSKVDHIAHMTERGLITKEDMPALKAIAKYENIDVSPLVGPYEAALEELQEAQDALDEAKRLLR